MFLTFLESGLFRVLRDEATDTNQGGGGGGDTPKTFTQEQVNAFLAKERKAFDAKLKEATTKAGEVDTVRAELEALREEKANGERTALEKAEAAHKKATEALQKQIAEKDSAAKAASDELFRERVTTRLSAELGKLNVIPAYLQKAVKLASLELQDLKIDGGKLTASYGDHVDASIADVVAAWVKDNENFLPAPSGGAGTRAPTGLPAGKSLADLSIDELLELDAAQQRARR